MSIILINKKVGETPFEAIQRYKKSHSKYKDVAMTYAGRLDPMAEGLLLVLSGKTIKRKKEFMKLNKEYIAEIAFGISSDTYDALGIVHESKCNLPEYKKIKDALSLLEGTHIVALPLYASYRVNGHPLFYWARKRNVEMIKIPKKKMIIKKISLIEIKNIAAHKIKKYVQNKIARVSGDFRQALIIQNWEKIKRKDFIVAKINIRCSSGTYIRSLAYITGKRLGVGAILLSLKRTKIGRYSIKRPII